MSDDALLRLLGWSSCAKEDNWCLTHSASWYGTGKRCWTQDNDLDRVRQGMALVAPILIDLIDQLRSPGMDDDRARIAADEAEGWLRETVQLAGLLGDQS